MHWDAKEPVFKLAHYWKNLHHICDHVFSGNRFLQQNLELYIKAETAAFKHLKCAFHKEWDATKFDFSDISKNASSYLKNLRESFFFVR